MEQKSELEQKLEAHQVATAFLFDLILRNWDKADFQYLDDELAALCDRLLPDHPDADVLPGKHFLDEGWKILKLFHNQEKLGSLKSTKDFLEIQSRH